MKKKYWLIYTIIIGISTLYIILFILKMNNQTLSTNAEDWANFGSIISPLVSLLTMIILIMTIQDSEKQSKTIIENTNNIEAENRHNQNIKELSELTIEMFKKVAYFFEDYKVHKQIEKDLESFRNNKTKSSISIRVKTNEAKVLQENYIKKFIDYEDIIITDLLRIETFIHLYFKNEFGAKILNCSNYLKDLFRHKDTVYNKIDTFFTISTDFNYITIKNIKLLKENFPINEIEDSKIIEIMNSESHQFDKKYGLNILDLNKAEESVKKKNTGV